jgi:hypothetical protein
MKIKYCASSDQPSKIGTRGPGGNAPRGLRNARKNRYFRCAQQHRTAADGTALQILLSEHQEICKQIIEIIDAGRPEE